MRPSPYPAGFLAEARQKLNSLRRSLSEAGDRIHETSFGSNVRESLGELSSVDNHPADIGTETFERSKDHGLEEHFRRLRLDVDRALGRLDSGTYGLCARCGGWIPQERLEALPQASRCLRCQARDEAQPTRQRPQEEGPAYPPFARTFRLDQSAYDGEDAWQDVARYGTSETPSDVHGTEKAARAYEDAEEPVGIVEEVEKLAKTGPEADEGDESILS